MCAQLSRSKTVMLVEDNYPLQQHLLKVLDLPQDIDCLGAFSSAEEALKKIHKYRPDVLLLDVNLPGISGIDCIRDLKEKLPNMEVVILTAYEEEDNIFRALKEGASGYLLKTSTPDDIYDAIRDVYSGGAPFSSHIARKVAQYFRRERVIDNENQSLTTREKEVLKLLASGYIYKEVSDQLDISIETVRTYVKRICLKLQVRSKVEAIIKYRA